MLPEDDSDRAGIGGLLLSFLLFWSLLTLGADFVIALNLVRQIRASGFPKAQGEILASKLTESWNDGSATFGITVRYSYTVNGIEFTGTTYRYRPVSGSRPEIERLVNSMPPGREVEVRYDPADPDNSILKPGLIGEHFFLITMLAPFNASMLAGWIAHRRLLRTGSVLEISLRDDGLVARADVDQLPPSLVTIIVAGCVGFADAILLLVITSLAGGGVSMAMGVISLLVNLLAPLVAWFQTPHINAYVARSITLDRARQTLTFTSASGRSAQNVDLAAAAGVEVNRLRDSSRGKRYSVSLTLHAGTGNRTAVSVIDSTSHRTASQLANWLLERLKFQEPNSTGIVGQ